MARSAKGITVAIDGPAGAGKSTAAKAVARELGYALVDTGAIYRSVALIASRRAVAENDEQTLAEIARSLAIEFELRGDINHVRVAGEDVTAAIRTPDISQKASRVSALPLVRSALLDLQRRLAASGGAVLEGRDIGTVVCPNAEVKFFLSATDEERARRRYEELVAAGKSASFESVLLEMRERDARDQNRAVAPLRPAADAVTLDSTTVSADEVTRRIVAAVRGAGG